MRVAIVHDYLTQRGGAERVVLSLHRMFPEAHVYTSLYDPEGTYPEFESVDIRASFLRHLPHRGARFRSLLPAYPAAFGSLRLRGYDLVLSSSSAFAHGVKVEDGFHVCYCHTPPRFLYLTDQYLAEGAPVGSLTRRMVLPPALAALRRWDRRAARRPDAYLANSRVAADRIERIYGRDALVVHPPVDLARPAAGLPPTEGDPYFLVVSRLLPYKRVDLAVRACRARGARLVVVGDGPDRARLEKLSGPGIEFRGSVDDRELSSLLVGAEALIQAGEEDFGLMPLEANAAGKPVVALGRGGALETVLSGVTGVLFDEPTVASLGEALDVVEKVHWDTEKLLHHAGSFSEHRFHTELRAALVELVTGAALQRLPATVPTPIGHVDVAPLAASA